MAPEDIIDQILSEEGSEYTDDPADGGGPTKYGITRADLATWRGRPVTPADVRDLTEEEARSIYLERYIEAPGFDKIADPGLRNLVVDIGVNQGVPTAIRFLQAAIGVTVDGLFGPKTLAAVNTQPPQPRLLHPCYLKVAVASLRAYGRLISGRPTQAKFAEGWINRRCQSLDALTE